MENWHMWSGKVLENAHEKVLERRGKPLSVFCMHPVVWSTKYGVIYRFSNSTIASDLKVTISIGCRQPSLSLIVSGY